VRVLVAAGSVVRGECGAWDVRSMGCDVVRGCCCCWWIVDEIAATLRPRSDNPYRSASDDSDAALSILAGVSPAPVRGRPGQRNAPQQKTADTGSANNAQCCCEGSRTCDKGPSGGLVPHALRFEAMRAPRAGTNQMSSRWSHPRTQEEEYTSKRRTRKYANVSEAKQKGPSPQRPQAQKQKRVHLANVPELHRACRACGGAPLCAGGESGRPHPSHTLKKGSVSSRFLVMALATLERFSRCDKSSYRHAEQSLPRQGMRYCVAVCDSVISP
jgi:hypothetical protein